MLKIILVIVGIIILICLLQSLIPFLVFAGILVGAIVLCMHYPSCTPYVVGAVVLFLVYGFYAKHIKPALKLKKDKRNNKRWLEVHKGNMSEAKRDSYLYEITGRIFGKYKESVYIQETIPWGRANVFLNYFESDINKEDVYFFQPIRSAKFDDLRENGYMITNKGLRYCIESDGKRYQNMVPFYRLKEVYIDENHKLVCKHIDSELITRETVIESKYITEFKRFFECIVESGINAIESCKGVWSVNVNENENVIEKDLLPRTSAGLGAERANEVWKKENKNYLNASQGGGYGAEYGNNTIDRLMGKDVVNAAQQLDESGKQIKNGADRIVNDVEIQTKYYKTPRETVNAAFGPDGNAKYIRTDGTGKMMQIEVPRDQYQAAVDVMQEKMNEGKVPGVEPGEDARNYVKKGAMTYSAAQKVACAGTIEGLKIDFENGIVYSKSVAGISGLISFSMEYWKTGDTSKAAQAGVRTVVQVLGSAGLQAAIAGQIKREYFLNKQLNNPINTLANNISKRMGWNLQNVSNNISTGVITFGPDIVRNIQGKISNEQLLKNISVTAAGFAAGKLIKVLQGGTPLSIAASVGATILVQAFLDNRIEDDTQKMYRVLKLVFLDEVMVLDLTSEEVQQVAELSIANKDLKKILPKMYQADNPEKFARKLVVDAIMSVMQRRCTITKEIENEALNIVLSELKTAVCVS